MSYLSNDPADFADEFLDGFTAAHADLVRRVPGGVARRTATPPGEVAVVIGGGSGHYPGFAGLVGAGLAHGAALGDVFASPSAQRVHAVARAVSGGAGVLLAYGNYAGDVLHFEEARRRLEAEGIPCRSVAVTDDIASASRAERARRRGIAGDLAVFKVAGAAAARGATLDEVEALARRANDRTRSLGVAFGGCTLPGAGAPLFTVPHGRMGVGMGIHGEPGIDEQDVPSADGLAALLVERLLAELPDDVPTARGARAVAILNGLGGVKYEELYVTYRSVVARLADAGVTVVAPEVGEFVTSFEMAGLSLTLLWLDDELETAWTAPALSPAYRRGGAAAAGADAGEAPLDAADDAVLEGSDASRRAARVALAAIEAAARAIEDTVDELGRLDAIAGDGDHGIGMQRGSAAALAAARVAVAAEAGAGTTLTRAGDAWADRAGGTSGALWGLFLRSLGRALGDEDEPGAQDVARGVAEGRDEVMRYGGARPGDKTLLDALAPFADELATAVAAGSDLASAWARAAETATRAAEATADMLPRMGRARPHAEKSLGTPDPGAVSLAAVARAVADVMVSERAEEHA